MWMRAEDPAGVSRCLGLASLKQTHTCLSSCRLLHQVHTRRHTRAQSLTACKTKKRRGPSPPPAPTFEEITDGLKTGGGRGGRGDTPVVNFSPDGRVEGGGDPGESSGMNNGCRILGDHVQTLIMDWAQLEEGSEVTAAEST